MTLPARVGLTVMAILIWGWLDFFIGTAGTLASAPLAGQQLANSDMGYITASYGTRLFSWFGAITTSGWWPYCLPCGGGRCARARALRI